MLDLDDDVDSEGHEKTFMRLTNLCPPTVHSTRQRPHRDQGLLSQPFSLSVNKFL